MAPSDIARSQWPQRFKRAIRERFLLRFHMLLIMAAVLFSGVVVSRVLRQLGMQVLWQRYPMAVVCSYGVFFIMIRLWLWYVSAASEQQEEEEQTALDVAQDVMMVADVDVGDVAAAAESTTRSGSKGVSDILDSDSEGLVLALLGLVLVAVLGSSLYMVWEAPTVLSEAALQMMLATSLHRAARRIAAPGWMGSVLGATWIPFVCVLVLISAFAVAATYYCPGATQLREILRMCAP